MSLENQLSLENKSRSRDDSTRALLSSCRSGDSEALGRLLEHFEHELRRKAAYFFAGERRAQTLQPTALVNEAYLRLAANSKLDWQSRAHFLAAAAKTMERILVDHARRKVALKRGAGEAPLALDALGSGEPSAEPKFLETLAVHEALEELARLSPRQAEVARYRCFSGMGHQEIAEVLGVSDRTIKTEWRLARIFLEQALGRRQG